VDDSTVRRGRSRAARDPVRRIRDEGRRAVASSRRRVPGRSLAEIESTPGGPRHPGGESPRATSSRASPDARRGEDRRGGRRRVPDGAAEIAAMRPPEREGGRDDRRGPGTVAEAREDHEREGVLS
jgi:hypothetical protein